MSSERGSVLAAVPVFASRGEPYRRRLEEAGFEVVLNPLGRLYNEDELCAEIPGHVATIAGSEPYTARVFSVADRLRVIARMGVGYDQIDLDQATRHRVAVAMAFGSNHEAVADHAFTMIAALARRLPAMDTAVRAGRWPRDPLTPLWRNTVGIVGLGRIGRALARRCRGFDMRVLAYDIEPDADYAAANGIELVGFDTLLSSADAVSLHVPLTERSRHMIDSRALRLMPPGAVLVNTARGGVVDEQALVEALDAGRPAGAALDVFELEPPAGSPLLARDDVILSPHLAGVDERALDMMLNRCVDSIIALLDGKPVEDGLVLNPLALQAAT